MRFARNATAIAVCALLSACASIMSGTSQSIKVDSNPPGARVFVGVKSRGGQNLASPIAVGITPAQVKLQRKDGVMFLEKDGYETAQVSLHRTMNLWVIGDIVLGSPLSIGIDTSTGAAKSYDPDEYLVNLIPVGGAQTPRYSPMPQAQPPMQPQAPIAPPSAPVRAQEVPPQVQYAPPPAGHFAGKSGDVAHAVAAATLLAKPLAGSEIRKTFSPGEPVHLISNLQNESGMWWFVSTDDEHSGWLRESDLR